MCLLLFAFFVICLVLGKIKCFRKQRKYKKLLSIVQYFEREISSFPLEMCIFRSLECFYSSLWS